MVSHRGRLGKEHRAQHADMISARAMALLSAAVLPGSTRSSSTIEINGGRAR